MADPVSYCDVPDLGRYGVNAEALELLPDAENQTPPIVAASGMIDSYLRQQFTLPLIRWGGDITRACAIIAAWDIIRVRGLKPGENPEDNAIYLAYKEVLRWLELVAAGKVAPDVVDSDTTTPTPGAPSGAARIASNTQRGYFTNNPNGALPFQGSRR